MEKKYEILKDDFIELSSTVLYRIKALKNFGEVKEGELGGYIESEDNLSQHGSCWVYDDSQVFSDSRITEGAKIRGNSKIINSTILGDFLNVYNTIAKNSFIQIKSGHAKESKFNNAYVFTESINIIKSSVSNKSSIMCEGSIVKSTIKNGTLIQGDIFIENNDINNSEINGNLNSNIAKISHSYINGQVKIKNVNISHSSLDYLVDITDSIIRYCDIKFGKYKAPKYENIKISNDFSDVENVKKILFYCMNMLPKKNNKYIMYKNVQPVNEYTEEFSSLYNSNFKYYLGKVAKEKYYDKDIKASCTSGLHVSTPTYWNTGGTILECEVDAKDIITILKDKVRCKKLKVLRAFNISGDNNIIEFTKKKENKKAEEKKND